MYLLKCSVCNGEFKTKESWTSHLIKKRHLNKARRKCVRWTPTRRRLVLVAYATFSMSSPLGLSLLQRLSKNLLNFVTDFVWREGNSRVGLIQFESSERLEKILATLGNPQSPRIEVDGYPVTFRRAIDLVDLEWEALVTPELETKPVSKKAKVRKRPTDEAGDENEQRKRKRSEQEETEIKSYVNNTSTTTTVVPPPVEILLSGSERAESLNTSHHDLDSSTVKQQILMEKFSSLLEPLRVPDSEFKVILGIIRDIELALSFKNPSVQVLMLRNWYLQLRTGTCDNPPPLLLFVYKEDDVSTKTVKWTPAKKSDLLGPLKKLNGYGKPIANSANNAKRDLLRGLSFTHKDSGIRCVIGFKAVALVDVQRCRLLQYYLTFDPRIKSLLTLIYLWSRINKIRISEKVSSVTEIHRDIPEPAALDWLLVVYLCKQKIIPTPREVQQRSHKRLYLQKGTFDMGFTEDPKLADRWFCKFNIAEDTDEFALNVLDLAGCFFLFCASLAAKPCLINTKDAEVLPSSYFRPAKTKNNSSIPEISTKLSPGQIKILRDHFNSKKGCQKLKHINIRHPFNLTSSFSIDDGHFKSNVSKKMKRTGEKLLRFVESINNNHKENNESLSSMYTNVDLESLLK